MINKVVIQAAGKGTRFKELTKDNPKHLLEVNGRPFLYYQMTDLLKAGFTEMILVVGYKAEQFEDFVKKYKFPAQIVNQFVKVPEKYGTACAVMAAEELVGEENFVAIAGDGLFADQDIKSMIIDDNYNYIAGFPVDNPEQYGVLKVDNQNYLEEIVEKPKEFVGNLINTAFYKFTPEIFDKLKQIEKSDRGEYEVVDAITLLAKEKKVKVKTMTAWQDFGKPSDLPLVEEFLKSKQY
ncbi:NTP transferase domain-containing protein [Patescibacteria group bacterium]|nr:NTP transferase domain-containing protein [Patescibacteria group bacterium]